MKKFTDIVQEAITMKQIKEKCKKCGWTGTMADLHTDRGGHHFYCPKCGAEI